MKKVTIKLGDSLTAVEVKPTPGRRIEKFIKANINCKLLSANPYEIVFEMDDDEAGKVAETVEKAISEFCQYESGMYELSVADSETPVMPEEEPEEDEECETDGEPFDEALEETGAAEDEESEPEEKTVPYDLEGLLNEVPMKHSEDLKRYLRETNLVIPMLKMMNNEKCIWSQNLLVSIDSGFGLTTFLRTLVKIHVNNGLVEDVKNVDCYFDEIKLTRKASDKDDEGSWGRLLNLTEKYATGSSRRYPTVVCIDISDYLPVLNTTAVSGYLKELSDYAKNFICVFRVPFMEKSVVDDVAETLEDVMNIRSICVPPIPMDDMVEYMKARLGKMGICADNSCDEGLENCLLLEKKDDSFFGYKTLNKVIDKVVYEKALKNAQTGEMSNKLDASDIASGDVTDINDFDPTERLRELIGMEAISVQINEIVAQMKVAKELAASGADVENPSIHMMFTGNPGTGKTTVARIVAKIMKEQGILRKGHMHEYRGRDLCGRYIGETAPKTSAICRDAYGSVLFIDEAYSLYRGESDRRDYGLEALDTLVAEMENHRDDMCVIFAGYTDEMNIMLNGNAGLRSRIPYIIEFPNYSREELTDIFFKMVGDRFEYDDEFASAVKDFFNNLPEETFTSKDFSNARFVRNLYEKVWGKAAYRKTISGDSKLTLLKSDLDNVSRGDEFKILTDKKTKKIGFI